MDKPRRIILASGSPRRKDLLAAAGYTFKVVVSDVDETIADDVTVEEAAEQLAQRKAQRVAELIGTDETILAADTIVTLDGRIYGKPDSPEEACSMLRELSGRSHRVITGVCLIAHNGISLFSETTEVTFRELSDEEIDTYVSTGEPLDKAGSYGIQGKGNALVDHIEGDYDNVVGLPVQKLRRYLLP